MRGDGDGPWGGVEELGKGCVGVVAAAKRELENTKSEAMGALEKWVCW